MWLAGNGEAEREITTLLYDEMHNIFHHSDIKASRSKKVCF